jgi:hypothetical protein
MEDYPMKSGFSSRLYALAFAGLLAGCAQAGSSGQSDQATQSQTKAAGPAATREMHGPPGPEKLLFAALQHLDLTTDQRSTIENAARAIGPMAPVDRSLLADIAGGVRAGKIDEGAVLAKFDAARPSADRAASMASALDTLHSTLTSDQRRAFVALVSSHLDEHAAEHEGTGPDPAAIIGRLLSKLSLTADQRVSIDRVLAAQDTSDGLDGRKPLRDQLRAQLVSFASERFDSAGFAASLKTIVDTVMRGHVRRTVHALSAILPVLDASQRETLATMVENALNHED